MVMLLGLMGVQMPANAQTFFKIIVDIASFDFFDTEDMINNLLDLEEKEPYKMHLKDAGFSSAYFLVNIGTQVFVFSGLLIVNFAFMCLSRINCRNATCRRGVKNGHRYFRDALVATVIESYIVIAICSVIGLHALGFTSFGETVQSTSAIIAAIVVVLMPVSTLVLYMFWDVINPHAQINKQFNVYLADLPLDKGR
jgi:hypothetical protein